MPELTPDRIAWVLTYYVVLLFSLSVHESAHAWMALRMGDDTASLQGRITLNPLSHIDPVGHRPDPAAAGLLLRLPLLGWAKPTPVAAHNFRRLARGHILVAAAGPGVEPDPRAAVHAGSVLRPALGCARERIR